MDVVWHNILQDLRYLEDEPMLFSSGIFWVLFMVFLPIYAAVKSRRNLMIGFVIAFSLYFYYKSSGFFVCLLLLTSLVDWYVSRMIAATDCLRRKRIYLAISLFTSLGILCYFKYANFFIWNINQLISSNFQPLNLILPVGISFYTFQSVSYIVDVYKGRVSPTRTWLEYLFFLSFFPALVAGPIVRAEYFLPQIKENRQATQSEVYLGFWMVMVGIAKKAIIADYISQYNDLIFMTPGAYSGFETLMGVIGYTMQIYCDFSGYSDMAIGLAMIMGFRLTPNFNFPYKARNLTDFWHRWHISLSTWLRDYIYIPLGGSRKGYVRTYLNIFMTMLIGGLWHGAAWKFVMWGALHGLGLAVHKLFQDDLKRVPDSFAVKAISWLLTFSFVSMLWVFFRADTAQDACIIIVSAFRNFSLDYIVPFVTARMTWCVMIAVIILVHALPTHLSNCMAMKFVKSPWIVKLALFMILVQLVIEFRGEDVQPFIYFQF
jgi:D-alanyl-lipoteichoic acid acyltransferase DltB (MBOAT superfamily)